VVSHKGNRNKLTQQVVFRQIVDCLHKAEDGEDFKSWVKKLKTYGQKCVIILDQDSYRVTCNAAVLALTLGKTVEGILGMISEMDRAKIMRHLNILPILKTENNLTIIRKSTRASMEFCCGLCDVAQRTKPMRLCFATGNDTV
jgi:hypothetical protein